MRVSCKQLLSPVHNFRYVTSPRYLYSGVTKIQQRHSSNSAINPEFSDSSIAHKTTLSGNRSNRRPERHNNPANASENWMNLPPPSTQSHHDLPSFLDYASRVGLDTQSTVYVGTHYEYTVQKSLSARLGVSTQRVGAANDRGIDLMGSWTLPTAPFTTVNVFVQCKYLTKGKAKPVFVRELSGAFRALPAAWDPKEVIGIIVTTISGTKAMISAMFQSDLPMVHILCTTDGVMRAMHVNPAAEVYLGGMDILEAYLPDGTNEIRFSWKV